MTNIISKKRSQSSSKDIQILRGSIFKKRSQIWWNCERFDKTISKDPWKIPAGSKESQQNPPQKIPTNPYNIPKSFRASKRILGKSQIILK